MSGPGTEIAAQVTEAVRNEQLATMDDLGRDAVLWLTLPPLWTRATADSAGFPAGTVIEFVRLAHAEGWCETRGSLRGGGSPDLAFWMPGDLRLDMVDLLGQGRTRQQLISEATRVAERIIERVPPRGVDPSSDAAEAGALRYWAELLVQPAPGLALVERVAAAVEAQDLPVAQQLVDAGEALAALLAGTMELAVDRARRLHSLGLRRRQDSRALGRYLDRPDLSGAVDDLLRPAAAQWALHLRGVGGVGKTMLVRYLASGRYAADRHEPDLTIARVDFDHMSPDYPVRRPVQLLVELADELALHTAAAGPADQARARFAAMATSVHESLSSMREERVAVAQNPRVLAAIDAFADTLRLVPRPLLILDTCEELAKADAGDPAAPTVNSTLAIIERIHEQAPGVRVLLAGRRPLPRQDYLAVTLARGFTLPEARTYLAAFSARPLSDDLMRAMISQSPAADLESDAPALDGLPGRVSPFDLALYREWADEDPDLDVRRVQRGSHAYVEGRIIGRLEDADLRRALPVLATAGRCRVTTIAAFLPADPALLGRRLAEQEWIEAPDGPSGHVSAGAALARRLRGYFSEPERLEEFTEQTTRLAVMLRRQVRDAPLDQVDGDELLTALRLSPAPAAARLWDAVAGRAARAGRWTWLYNICRRVIGESQEEAWPTAPALRASVAAAAIAASRRTVPGFYPATAWAEVNQWADGHPDHEAAKSLRARALLGMLAHAPDDASHWTALARGLGQYAPAELMNQVAAAAADAVHTLLEAGNSRAALRVLDWVVPGLDPRPRYPAIPGEVPDATRVLSEQIRAWLLVALARLAADGDGSGACRVLIGAEDAARHADDRSWFDLIPPDDLTARIRIERGLVIRSGARDEHVNRWREVAFGLAETPDPELLSTIDGERLASLSLRYVLDHRVVEAPLVARWAEADQYQPGRIARGSAHDLVPPLFVTVADLWLAAGDPQQALDHIARQRQAALATRDDEETVRHADAATVAIARRLRLDDQLALLARLASPDHPSPAQLGLADDARRALAVLRGEAPSPSDPLVTGRPAGWHTWWQCQVPPVDPVAAAQWAEDADPALVGDVRADLDEFGLLSRAKAQWQRDASPMREWLLRPAARRARTADPYDDVRLALRRWAHEADRPPDGDSEEPRQLDRYVPPRAVADIAFSEGELRALRFRAGAVWLFEVASASFAEAGDHTGRVLAELARLTTILTAQPGSEPPDQPALDRFREAMAEVPEGTEIPFAAGVPGATRGPWRYWARCLAGLPSEAGAARPSGQASQWRRAGLWLTRVLDGDGSRAGTVLVTSFIVGVAAGIVFAATALCYLVLSLPGFGPLIVAAAAAAVGGAVALAARGRRAQLRSLADGVAVGSFPLSQVMFSALIEPGLRPGGYALTVRAHLRYPYPWYDTWRQWVRPLAITAALWLESFIPRRQARRDGYRARFAADSDGYAAATDDEAGLSWDADRPRAEDGWWTGTTEGVIRCQPSDAARPWERIIVGGLGPHATGRIAWRRHVFVSNSSGMNLMSTQDYVRHREAGVRLDAASRWTLLFADYYATHAALVQVQHAVGPVVLTSAGTRLEVDSGTPGRPWLLGPEDFGDGSPSLLIIQAEPTQADAGAGPDDEIAARQATESLQTQLAFAVDLLRSAVAPAVLLLPALPASMIAATAEAVAGYARTIATGEAAMDKPQPSRLQAELRDLLRPGVPPAVLDDIVLFTNGLE